MMDGWNESRAWAVEAAPRKERKNKENLLNPQSLVEIWKKSKQEVLFEPKGSRYLL